MSDFPSSPALSLSLAGIFQAATENLDESEDQNNIADRKKKRRKYHRHTPKQIQEMERESPHPDEKQRLLLSRSLGLHPHQVKFWFQNRRTQIKAVQERHENSVLKSEIDKLRDENKGLRDPTNKPSCPNCGFAVEAGDQKLRIENDRLKAEVEKLTSFIQKQKHTHGTSPNTPPHLENESSVDEKSRIMDAANRAVDELRKMAAENEPLWVQSYETGREILNYDEYMKEFPSEKNRDEMNKLSIEASRESGIIFADLPWIVQSFMDVNQWKELFSCLVAKAVTMDVVCSGEGDNRDGAVHLMFAEVQMMTPMVATREVSFVRHCKRIDENHWAIVDVSVDRVEDSMHSSLQKCRKRPSGIIIEDKSDGHCKVTWVEHSECQKTSVHSLYRTTLNTGFAFGAKRWISTLQQQCERLVFLMATNVPVKDSSGVTTVAGRKSILRLAQRMTCSFCKALGCSSHNSWTKTMTKTGEDIRVASRKNFNDPGNILSLVSSVWLPVYHLDLFNFLRDETRRNEWDTNTMSNGGTIQSIAKLVKGQDRGNAVTVLEIRNEEQHTWVLQDSSTNQYESMVVYAPVDIKAMQSVMTGCDSSSIAVLPSGFSIIPDGIESRPLVISSRKAEDKSVEGGSLLTIGFQVQVNNSPMEKPSMDSVDSVKTLVSCVLQSIKRSLNCEE